MKILQALSLVVTVCVAGICSKAVPGQLYSSLVYMDQLFFFDRKVGSILAFLPDHTEEVTSYLESYSWVTVDASQEGSQVLDERITGNPLHIFAVIKRLVLYWPFISETLNSYVMEGVRCTDHYTDCHGWSLRGECHKGRMFMAKNCKKSCGLCPQPGIIRGMAEVREAESKTVFPTENDLRGAALALVRLQRVYLIPILSMARGRLFDSSTSVRLSVRDCLMIANESYSEGEYVNAWQWYDYSKTITVDPEILQHIKSQKDIIAQEHDQNGAKVRYSKPKFFSHSLSNYTNQIPRDTAFARLCRGDNLLTAEEKGRLHCHTSDRGSPFLILQPVEYEQVHYDPPMYLFYNVIHPKEIEVVKQVALSKLQRSGVVREGGPSVTEFRVSQTAWLGNNSHPVVKSITNRISSITGLHVYEGRKDDMGGEELQVLSYGVGGHYDQHVDLFFKYLPSGRWNESKSPQKEFVPGERIATMMFYLSDVEMGGRTAFPKAGVSVAPVKGAAILWYNVRSNGEGNQKSWHGGCPVLLGHKWVANKWIRENVNFLRRPCTLDPEE